MGIQIVTVWTDDLDGSKIAEGEGETVAFSFGGTAYEIDLSASNAEEFRSAMSKYIAAARQREPRSAPSGGRRRGSSSDLSAVRVWLKENGYPVSDRGRIPANLMDVYRRR